MENQKNLKKILQNINTDVYRLFIFDFDGTICEDLSIDWVGLKQKLCALVGESFKNQKVNEILYKIKTQNPNYQISQIYKIIESFEKPAINKAIIRPEMEGFIHKIKLQKKKTSIFSNNMRKTILTILKKFKLLEKFDLVIAKDDVLKYKPDPEGLIKITDFLKIDRNKVLFIDNEQIDFLAGQKAIITSILI